MFSGLTSFIDNLQRNPLGTIVTLLYSGAAVLLSLILHECAHGYAALKCGDPTAKMMGRLTLNPAKHLDPIGTVCMLFLHIGWAKPVPVNPRNFRNWRRDMVIVSLAGIAMNLALCFISLMISSILAKLIWNPEFVKAVSGYADKTVFLNIYQYNPANNIYAGEFSAWTAYCSSGCVWLLYIQRFFLMLAAMNLGLAVFNLLPVPPLDGYRFLDAFVFKGRLSMSRQTMQIISIGFMVVIFSGLLDGLLGTVNSAVFGVLSQTTAWII